MNREEIDAYRQGQNEPNKETIIKIITFVINLLKKDNSLTIKEIYELYKKD